MPVSKKRKVEPKEVKEQHIDIQNSKGGKILLLILVISMVLGMFVGAIIYMLQDLAK